MKINLKKMLPYFEDEELMELYEKIAEKGNGTFFLPGGYFVVCVSGLLKWEKIYRNICRMCRTRAFTS